MMAGPVLGREPRPADGDGRRGARRPARRSCAAARSSRGRARTPSRGWASRRSATSPRRASGPACRSSPRSWSRTRSTSSPSTPTSSRSAPATCRTTRCSTRVGRVARPVMLKRGYGATVEEWLMAAEYIVSSGNPNVILCERGIRTFETYTRNTMDLAAVPLAPPPDPPAGDRRPEPRHREALAGPAAGDRRRRGRGRRGHGRGPPEPGRGALRRRAAADARRSSAT